MTPVEVRPLGPEDDAAMLAVCRACPIEAALRLLFDRGDRLHDWPDRVFDRYRYVGAFVGGQLVGYTMLGWLTGWLGDGDGPYGYLGDARILPAFRRQHLATRLVQTLLEPPPDDLRGGLALVAAGNHAALASVGGRPGMRHGATLHVRNLPLFAAPRWEMPPGYSTRPAGDADLEPMADLFRRAWAGRPFVPHLDARGLHQRLHRFGLVSEDVTLVTHGGDVAAFGVAWDMAPFHVTRVLGYSLAGRLQKLAWDVAATCAGAARLPAPGEPLRALTLSTWATHDASALRALLAGIGVRHRRSGHHLLHLGLMEGDPLAAAVDGLWAPRLTSEIRYAERPEFRIPVGLPWVDLATL